MTEEEKAELQAQNQARIGKFATAVQEEHFAPRDLRVLRKATQKAEQTTSQEVEQNADQKDAFPLLSQALADQELTPLQYRKVIKYLGKNPEFSQYEKDLQNFITEGRFDDLVSFFEAGLANDLIKMMRKKLI